MRHLLIVAMAAVAVAGGAFAADAQQDQDNETEKRPPQAQGRAKEPKQAPSATQRRGSAGPQRESAQGGQQGIEKRTEPRSPKATDKAQSDKTQPSTARKAEEPAPKFKRTAQDKSEAPNKGAAERDAEDARQKGTAQRKEDDGQNKGPAAASKESPKQDKEAREGRSQYAELSQDQRTRVRTTIRQQNVQRVTNVNFSIQVGTRVPRTVTLHALPRTVVEIVPYYRGYRYFVVEERICIVDPATYEIIYVIDESGPSSRTARLEVSASQRLFILSHLDLDRPSTDVRIRLALGAEIPNRVELLAFPDPVVATIPEIRRYRYVVVDRSVVIVDPYDREVALVVER
jgi:hypothetical protein